MTPTLMRLLAPKAEEWTKRGAVANAADALRKPRREACCFIVNRPLPRPLLPLPRERAGVRAAGSTDQLFDLPRRRFDVDGVDRDFAGTTLRRAFPRTHRAEDRDVFEFLPRRRGA